MESFALNIDNYLISPLFILLILGGIIGGITFFFLLKIRHSPGVKYWLIWQLASSFWALMYAFEYAATDIESKIFWSKLSYFGIVYCAVSFFFFSFEFSYKFRYVKKRLIVILYSISTLFILSPFTNGMHHLHWKNYYVIPETNATGYVYGPLFWIFFAFTYFLLISATVNIISVFFRFSRFYRPQIILILIASLLPLAGNLIYVFHLNPVPGFDWTPFTFLITGVLIAINISYYKMFDLVPFGRNKLIDKIPDAIFIIDRSGMIADCNPAISQFADLDHKTLIGRQVNEVFPEWENLIREFSENDECQTVLSQDLNGEVKHFELTSSAIYDPNRQKKGRLVVVKDITKYVVAEEKIQEANDLLKSEIQEKEILIEDLDSFSHTVAHDLKNNLGIIVSASELIKSGTGELPKEDLLELAEMIHLSATQTIHITRELLTLASVRKEEIKFAPVDMRKIVSGSMSRLKLMIREKGAIVSIPETWPTVTGYEAWLEEVMTNYISNAIKYGGNPPKIALGFDELPDNRVKFWVKDNGKGLSESDISMLFHKFTRLNTLRIEGHGLGLSIVKRIIEKLNGEVGVESENIPGKGSVFYFILPLAPDSLVE
jgi:PAS domain S-box-containing protein